MESLDLRDFTDYENMAMLELSESESALIRGRFDEIAGGFSALDAFGAGGADDLSEVGETCDLSGVEPLVSVLDLNNVLREDVAAKAFSREEILKNAPEQYDGYFQVPAAIE